METANGELAEARAAVARLRQVQEILKLSDGQFVKRFIDAKGGLLLGSDRTWTRMRTDKWDDNKPTKWLGRLKEACTRLDGGTPVRDPLSLPFYEAMMAELDRLEAQMNDRRALVALAPTGTGKTVFARRAVELNRTKRVYVRAKPSWRESGPNICVGLYEGLTGESLQYVGYEEALKKVGKFLAAAPKTVIVDEAHEGGIELMKVLRHLIDETAARFVYLAYPTEYSRVVNANKGALAEARQFIGRSLKPIFTEYQDGTKPEDVAVILEHAGLSAMEAQVVAQEITPQLLVREGLRTLDDALEVALLNAEEDNVPISRLYVKGGINVVSGLKDPEEKSKKLKQTLANSN